MAAKPVRVRRSRAKGSKLESPNGLPVVCVSRGTRWGNPHVVDEKKPGSREAAMRNYRRDLELGKLGFSVEDVRRELAGKNLACWCRLDQECHADILLELANS
jgi:hypothetical protein